MVLPTGGAIEYDHVGVGELDDGARRYVKNGYYLIKDKAGKILSYGRVNE